MAEINKRQAFVIEGAEALPNPNGTAPGQWIEDGGRVIMLLPGPPGEMKPMFDGPVPAAARSDAAGAGDPHSRLPHRGHAGIRGGSADRARLHAVRQPGDDDSGRGGRYPGAPARARCDAEARPSALLAELGSQIEAILGDRIYREEPAPPRSGGGQRLLRRAAETLSRGRELHRAGCWRGRMTSVAGSSDYFLGGFLTYTNR